MTSWGTAKQGMLQMHREPITVTPAEASRLSGLSLRTVWRMISSGELETVRVRNRRLISFESLKQRFGSEVHHGQ